MKDLFEEGGLKRLMAGDPNHKSYYCPFCNELLMRGNVKSLSMVCSNCRKLIRATNADELVRND